MERIGVLVVKPEETYGKYTVLKNALGYIYLQRTAKPICYSWFTNTFRGQFDQRWRKSDQTCWTP